MGHEYSTHKRPRKKERKKKNKSKRIPNIWKNGTSTIIARITACLQLVTCPKRFLCEKHTVVPHLLYILLFESALDVHWLYHIIYIVCFMIILFGGWMVFTYYSVFHFIL